MRKRRIPILIYFFQQSKPLLKKIHYEAELCKMNYVYFRSNEETAQKRTNSKNGPQHKIGRLEAVFRTIFTFLLLCHR